MKTAFANPALLLPDFLEPPRGTTMRLALPLLVGIAAVLWTLWVFFGHEEAELDKEFPARAHFSAQGKP
jgi:hypothetical protein